MSTLFRNIYSWFYDLYGENLYEYLKGWSCESEALTNPNHFFLIGLITIGISLSFVLLYYYAIHHPRFANWWSWLIVLFTVGIINLFVGFGYTYTKFTDGQIEECLLYNNVFDENGNLLQQTQLIWESDCWGFGIANMIISIIFFIIFSFCLKWWSRTSKYVPF